MDVVNTFLRSENTSYFTDVELSEKTTILREHKNRWKAGTYQGGYLPIIDFYTEGISPILFKKSERTLFHRYDNNDIEYDSFYLIYRSQTTDENSPLDVLLCGESGFEVKERSTGYYGYFDPRTQLKTKWCAVVYGSDGDGTGTNIGGKLSFSAKGYDSQITITLSANTCVIIQRKSIFVGTANANGFTISQTYWPKGTANFRSVYLQDIYRMRVDTSGNNWLPYAQFLLTYNTTYILGLSYATDIHAQDGSTKIIGSIYDIDRTDPKLLKIIKLPYCPIDLYKDETYIILPSDWRIKDANGTFPSVLEYKGTSLTSCLKSRIHLTDEDNSLSGSPFNKFRQRSITSMHYMVRKNMDYEPKLLHSDFYIQKLVYDSFSFDFRGEYMPVVDGPMDLNADFSTSTTMSSNFMFRFLDLYFDPDTSVMAQHIDTQNYSNVMCIRRNNELPIYNSAYLNYIRTGFNYDIKTKERQLITNTFTSILSGAGAVVGTAIGGPVGLGVGVSLATTTLASATNLISNQIQADNNISEKMRIAEMQGLSVAGSDDIDILSEFSNGNKAKLVEYEVSEKMKKCLFDLFYYCGYIANYQGVPELKTRENFNFIQAEVVFKKLPNVPKEIVDELIAKYKEGITFLHSWEHEVEESGETRTYLDWDFDQNYENWETTLS